MGEKQIRQSVYSRIAGYEDVNDAERLAQDPTCRLIGSEKTWDRGAALTSRLQTFETGMLAEQENFGSLARINRELICKMEVVGCIILLAEAKNEILANIPMLQMSKPARACCVAGVLMAAAACSRVSAAPAEKRFVCGKFGFSVLVPPGWTVQRIGALPMFFSFDPGDSIPVIHLPEGGATINMQVVYKVPKGEPSPQWLHTLRDYVAAGARAGGATNPVLHSVGFPPEAAVPEALMATWDLAMQAPEVHHTVMVCWEFKGKFLDADLHYVKGDPKGAEHEKIFFETIRSFRPVRK